MNIGELSRLTGLPVKTIRYYSDVGLVPEAERSPAGYRRYDHAAIVRLEFVRTLRELGLDLATIRQVLDRGADLRGVAAAHAEALGTQIRVLRLRRAALRACAASRPTCPTTPRTSRSTPGSSWPSCCASRTSATGCARWAGAASSRVRGRPCRAT